MEIKIDKEEIAKAVKEKKRNYTLANIVGWANGLTTFALAEYFRGVKLDYRALVGDMPDMNLPAVHSHQYIALGSTVVGILTSFIFQSTYYYAKLKPTDAGRFHLNVALCILNNLFGRKQSAISAKKRFAELISNPLDKQLELAELDLEEKRFDLAFERYDSILNAIQSENLSVSLYERINERLSSLLRYICEAKDVEYFATSAVKYFRRGEVKKAKENLVKAVEIEPTNLELNVLYAYFLETMRDRHCSKQFAKVAEIASQDESTKWESLEESKNDVHVISGDRYISKALIVKNSDDRAHLQGERDLIALLEKEVKGDSRFHLPVHMLDITFQDGKWQSYMRRDKHERLDERIAKNHPSLERNLDDISDFSSIIYCAVPLEMLPEEVSEIAIISERLKKAGFDVDTILRVLDNVEPLIHSLRDSPRVYKKDPHVRQWGIWPDETVEAFDFEPAPRVPLEKDVSNLTNTANLPKKIKLKVHERIITGFNSRNKQGIKVDIVKSRLALYNASVLRALEVYGPLSRIKKLADMRTEVIKSIKVSLDSLESEFPDYYNSRDFRSNYTELRLVTDDFI